MNMVKMGTSKGRSPLGLRYIDSPVCVINDQLADGDLTNHSRDGYFYVCNDANFNVTAMVDDSGTPVQRYRYDPYGRPEAMNGSWTQWGNAAYGNEFLYCGYRYDTTTGLYHVRHRAYHPTLGRWLQRDPAGYVDGMSLYEYASCSPAVFSDPRGLESVDQLRQELQNTKRKVVEAEEAARGYYAASEAYYEESLYYKRLAAGTIDETRRKHYESKAIENGDIAHKLMGTFGEAESLARKLKRKANEINRKIGKALVEEWRKEIEANQAKMAQERKDFAQGLASCSPTKRTYRYLGKGRIRGQSNFPMDYEFSMPWKVDRHRIPSVGNVKITNTNVVGDWDTPIAPMWIPPVGIVAWVRGAHWVQVEKGVPAIHKCGSAKGYKTVMTLKFKWMIKLHVWPNIGVASKLLKHLPKAIVQVVNNIPFFRGQIKTVPPIVQWIPAFPIKLIDDEVFATEKVTLILNGCSDNGTVEPKHPRKPIGYRYDAYTAMHTNID